MLSPRQIRRLRAQAHALHPLVRVGQNGVHDAVLGAIDEALEHHELVKIRVPLGEDRTSRAAIVQDIARTARASLVQCIGHVVVLYRAHPERPVIDPGPV